MYLFHVLVIVVLVGISVKIKKQVLITILFLGTIGGVTTFSSAKVRNAMGRIGIFKY